MSGLLRDLSRAAVVAGTAAAVSSRAARRPASRPGGDDDPMASLVALRRRGVLTRQEFATARARLRDR